MGCAVFPYGDAGMGCADFHVQMGIADGVADLLISAACREHGKGAGKGDFPYSGKSCRNAHHVAFCDTAVNMAFGERLLEGIGLGGICQVGIQNHQVGILCAEFSKCLSVSFSGCNFLNRLVVYF